MDFKDILAKVADGEVLTFGEAQTAFTIMMDGEATPTQIGAFLMALRVRGETVTELAGAVATMRAKMLPVRAPEDAIDIVGTGGDKSGSYNVSTCAAFIVAGAGVPVAKHGNRALSSRSGAADTLAALGVNIDIEADHIGKCIEEAGIGFMFAPKHHAAVRHVGPSRVEMGVRTAFNLLGPLSNPAGVSRQLVGVFSPDWLEPIANVLKELGTQRAWIVHGQGLDELTTTGRSQITALENGEVHSFMLTPEEAGLSRVDLDQLKGGDAEHNAAALRSVLDGEAGPYRDISLLNAAAALIVADKAQTIAEGMKLAAVSIDSGAASGALAKLAEISNAPETEANE